MSVLVKRLRSPTIEVYVKGAPEIMRDICRAESLEQDLEFLGIIIFENKLKPETPPVIETLKRAKIRQIMCTGDNVLTAISVSRECGLISKNTKAYIPQFVKGSSVNPRSSIVWESLDNSNDLLDSQSLKPIRSSENYSEFSLVDPFEYDLAVTGDVFRWIVDYGDEMTLYRMLIKGQIFARMSPDEKHELVEKLQEIGYCVGFCGDGANDCGALKAADVGLSLSDAEASVAAPFTSRNMDIGCVIEVIK
ncbi:2747_t:CDS:2 [Diversispora eburnea]|uniref:2747_t:CDS:1 n=1 Tax=Diversispora eburnea TaxID=1213867 RepID=A0A9N8V6D7_9GLOM|nr:2747_t:CDS:2 [Diversispora eburnea]